MKKTKILLGVATVLMSLSVAGSSVSAKEVKENDNIYYVVESGDTLSSIADKYEVDFTTVHGNNEKEVKHADVINVGQKLLVGGKDFDKEKSKAYSVSKPVVIPQEVVTYEQPVQEYTEVQEVSYTSTPVATTGGDGSVAYASQRMADATGLSADYWTWIIMAESSGNSTITNPTGHYGYFQISPIHGMPNGASVDTQIDYAINIYNSQGLSAWEVTH